MQFSLRTLLIATLILGPLSGWYGPGIVAQLHELMTKEPEAQPVVQYQLQLPPQQLQMLQWNSQLDSNGIERGMQVDMLQRREQFREY